MAQDDDRRAPYKVYEGDELKGTYATRAEARRRQQQLESQQATGSGPQRCFIIKDSLGRIVI
jgi:hypothetical protein